MTWDAEASKALDQAINQAPVPSVLKGQMRKQLTKAAENYAATADRTNVTAEDLMQGLLSQMPDKMRNKVETAMAKGPAGLKDLQDQLKK